MKFNEVKLSTCGIILTATKMYFYLCLLFKTNSKNLGYSDALTMEVNGANP